MNPDQTQVPPKKVLLIEDEESIRDLYKTQLGLSGYTCDSFASGNEGLEAGLANHYDVVLLDIMLPDINGLDILKKLKQDPSSKTTPIILLTNLGQDAIIKDGFELGADAYLVKASYTPEQVVQEMAGILAKRQPQSQS